MSASRTGSSSSVCSSSSNGTGKRPEHYSNYSRGGPRGRHLMTPELALKFLLESENVSRPPPVQAPA
jgi:hypothetical protein